MDLLYANLVKRVDYKEAEFVTTMQAAADTYKKEVFNEQSTVNIRGVEFMAPRKIVEFLKFTYKNYVSIPPIESRFREFYDSINRLKYFESNHTIKTKSDWQINDYK